jgi:ectoine hydroxylase-related dioxygenase (phytanoyl-CoA dioxygenase family)
MSTCDSDDQLTQYKEQGYTIFEGLYNEAQMQPWREEVLRLEAASTGVYAQPQSWWFGNMLERSPALMWPTVSSSTILDFAESVVGPFVQLDNLTLAAFPSVSNEEAKGKVSKWHRDRWGRMPGGHYERPLSMNAICYLQDLSDDYGPLRVIPGSHVNPVALTQKERELPHVDEVLVHMKAGDVVLTHSGLLHSGTPNTSGKRRFFFSVFYNISWLKYTDTFDGPNCRQLIDWARARNDHRSLRLLGVEDHLQARGNSGFQEPDEERWQQWIAEDRAALKEVEETI